MILRSLRHFACWEKLTDGPCGRLEHIGREAETNRQQCAPASWKKVMTILLPENSDFL